MKLRAALVLGWVGAWASAVRADDGLEGAVIGDRPPVAAPYPVRGPALDVLDEDAMERRYEAMTERNSPEMMATGIVLVALGGVTAVAGFFLFVPSLCNDTDPPMCSSYGPDIVSVPMMINGAVAVLVGMPLIAVGRKRVPVRSAAAPEVLVTPRGGGLRWTF